LVIVSHWAFVNTGRQLTTFNHQGLIMIGGKADVSGHPVAAYQGTVAGHCGFNVQRYANVV